MPDSAADRREQILDTAELLLRRHGLEKTGVVDIARALGLSHAAVYRYFPTKDALREAVAERWLHTVSAPLAAVARRSGSTAGRKLEAWVKKLAAIKSGRLRDDPEMFRTYHAMVEQSRDMVERHVGELLEQVRHIIEEGCASGEFNARDPARAAAVVLNGTLRFHHPTFLLQPGGLAPGERELEDVLAVIVAGLRSGAI